MQQPATPHLRPIRGIRQASLWLAALLIVALPALANAAQAGLMRWSFDYHQNKVDAAIWYPTEAPVQTIDAGPFTLHAASNGPLANRRHPLVIVSHGTGGSNLGHHTLAEALARAGFMVAALTHPGDNYQDRSLIADRRYFSERPRQLSAMLHALLADPKLGDRIDRMRIGAIGHSAGGHTVAASIGAQPNRASLIDHCQSVSDDPSCNYRDPTLGVSSPTTNPFVLPADSPAKASSTIASIRSAVLLAPLATALAADAPLGINVSLRIIGAEHDEILPHAYHLRRLQSLAPRAEVRIAEGAGHFSFIAPVNQQWQSRLGEVASDPAGFDRAKYHHQLAAEMVSWFTTTLN